MAANTPKLQNEGDTCGIDRDISALVLRAMSDNWAEICADTGCHPLDIERRGRELHFTPRHWARMVADDVASLLASRIATHGWIVAPKVALVEQLDALHPLCNDYSPDEIEVLKATRAKLAEDYEAMIAAIDGDAEAA